MALGQANKIYNFLSPCLDVPDRHRVPTTRHRPPCGLPSLRIAMPTNHPERIMQKICILEF